MWEFGRQKRDEFNFDDVKTFGLDTAKKKFESALNSSFSNPYYQSVNELCEAIENLTPKEFYFVIKKLKSTERDITKIVKALEDMVKYKNLHHIFLPITKILNEKDSTLDPGDKINNIILIARLCYPFGINMKNADINEINSKTINEVSYNANNTLKVSLCSIQKNPIKIIITPRDGRTIIKTNHPDSHESVIENGQGMVLGRELRLSNIFKIEVNASVKTRLSSNSTQIAQAKQNNQLAKFSRGGLLVVRLNNRIFLFDRGALNSMEIISTNHAESGFYVPDTLIKNTDTLE